LLACSSLVSLGESSEMDRMDAMDLDGRRAWRAPREERRTQAAGPWSVSSSPLLLVSSSPLALLLSPLS
ncbi:MAG: hypothetical protein ACO38W_04780, partial [Phycisphaerales bacterium]